MAEMFDAIFCSDVFRRCRIKLLLVSLQYAQVFAFLPAACDLLGEVGCGQPVLLSNRAKNDAVFNSSHSYFADHG
jgi:hypothetical protein